MHAVCPKQSLLTIFQWPIYGRPVPTRTQECRARYVFRVCFANLRYLYCLVLFACVRVYVSRLFFIFRENTAGFSVPLVDVGYVQLGQDIVVVGSIR